jgi:hypothetical protein
MEAGLNELDKISAVVWNEPTRLPHAPEMNCKTAALRLMEPFKKLGLSKNKLKQLLVNRWLIFIVPKMYKGRF